MIYSLSSDSSGPHVHINYILRYLMFIEVLNIINLLLYLALD